VKWVISYGLNRIMVLELITGFFSCRTLRRSINQFKRVIHRLHNMMCVNLGDAGKISREAMRFVGVEHGNNRPKHDDQICHELFRHLGLWWWIGGIWRWYIIGMRRWLSGVGVTGDAH